MREQMHYLWEWIFHLCSWFKYNRGWIVNCGPSWTKMREKMYKTREQVLNSLELNFFHCSAIIVASSKTVIQIHISTDADLILLHCIVNIAWNLQNGFESHYINCDTKTKHTMRAAGYLVLTHNWLMPYCLLRRIQASFISPSVYYDCYSLSTFSLQMVSLLLAKGANINAFDKKDCRALHWAAFMGEGTILYRWPVCLFQWNTRSCSHCFHFNKQNIVIGGFQAPKRHTS